MEREEGRKGSLLPIKCRLSSTSELQLLLFHSLNPNCLFLFCVLLCFFCCSAVAGSFFTAEACLVNTKMVKKYVTFTFIFSPMSLFSFLRLYFSKITSFTNIILLCSSTKMCFVYYLNLFNFFVPL